MPARLYLKSGLDDGLAKEESRDKGDEWHHKVATHNAGKIKQWVWDLRGLQ